MKFVYPEINRVFNTEEGVNSIVIENPGFLFRMLQDIQNQVEGNEGRAVLSRNNKEIPINKNLELITQFISFSLNSKSLLSKLNLKLEQLALDKEYYEKTLKLLNVVEKYLMEISFELSADIDLKRITIASIIKAAGVGFCDEYDNLAEKLIDYFELVYEFDKEKLFILYNVRSFLSTHEVENFIDTINRHGFHVIMIESREYERLHNEIRYIVDEDLCEFM